MAEPLSYKRIYSDLKGESHFANEEISFKLDFKVGLMLLFFPK